MAFLKNLWKASVGGAISGFKDGVSHGIIHNGLPSLNYDQEEILEEITKNLDEFDITPTSFKYNMSVTHKDLRTHDTWINPNFGYKNKKGKIIELRKKQKMKSETVPVVVSNDNILRFKTPDWNYGDWINERDIWRKQITNVTGEPGWFYFKVFFHFDTQQGLFGGILNDDDILNAENSAGKFLKMSENLSPILYSKLNLSDRLTALYKFTSILSYITTEAPWFFKTVKGLQEANNIFTKDLSKDKTIEITCSRESVDMRLNTMIELYKYAAFDNINFKEVIPENLRKFDMTILVFNTPIKKYHTAMKSGIDEFGYKNMINSSEGYSNFMTYKMFTFKNCEFDINSLSSIIVSDISNESPVKMENMPLKIKYDRVYTHMANEFFGIVFGEDGIYYNEYNNKGLKNAKINSLENNYLQRKRYNALQKELSNNVFGKSLNKKAIIDASEELSNVIIHNTLDTISDIGKNQLLKWLKVSYSTQSIFGNLYGDTAPRSKYFYDKIKTLKKGYLDLSPESYYYLVNQDAKNFNLKDWWRNTFRSS